MIKYCNWSTQYPSMNNTYNRHMNFISSDQTAFEAQMKYQLYCAIPQNRFSFRFSFCIDNDFISNTLNKLYIALAI